MSVLKVCELLEEEGFRIADAEIIPPGREIILDARHGKGLKEDDCYSLFITLQMAGVKFGREGGALSSVSYHYTPNPIKSWIILSDITDEDLK